MTAYTKPLLQTTSEAAREAREKRRKVLEAAEQTRKANYERFLQRMASLEKTLREKNRRLQVNADLI